MLLFASVRYGPIDGSPVATGRRVFAALLLVVAFASPAAAQVLYGSLTGNVTDQTGAVQVGATVTAVNTGTGVTRTAVTNDHGVYTFNDLQPGAYDVTIEAPSFKTHVRRGVRIDANAVFRVDAQLEISSVAESVEVTATTVPLQTDRADVHVTQSGREITALPLTGSMGRNYQSLMQVVPGAVMAGEQNSAAGSPQRSISFNVNGQSRLQNNTKLDGASIVYPWLPTNTAYVPSSEAIEQVNVVTNAFTAEQGMAGGSAINVIIKSGTNSLRGTGWIYDTNSKYRARNYFQTGGPNNSPDDLKNFGANLGGPLMKNKLFFFSNWERAKRVNSSPVRTISIAPSDLRNGDFSAAGVTIYDPASDPDPSKRTPFPGNVIPANRIDPAAIELIKRMPLPNGNGYVNNHTAQGEGTFRRDNIDIKVNYAATNRLSMFARYSISPSLIFDPPALGDAGGDALNGGQLGNAPGRTQVAGIGGTYTIGTTMLLDATIGYTRQRLGAENTDIDQNLGLDLLHIPGTNGPDRLQGGMPSFQIGGWSNLGNPNTGNPFLFRDNQYVASVNFQWMKKSHAMRFGWDYQNQQINHFQPQGGTFQTARGTFVFNGNMTRLQNGPTPADTRFNSWADFLLGLPSAAGKVEQLRNPNSVYMQAHALYAQDSWQMSRVTLTYGLRWERYPWPTRDHTGVSRFDPTDGNVYTGGVGGVPMDTGASAGNGLFLPRVGVAYRLNEKTVVRTGYGQTADPKPYIEFRNAYPINFAWSHPAATFNGATNTFIPVTTLRQGLDAALYGVHPDLNQGIIRLPTGAGTATYPKKDERKPIHSWNVFVQREFWSGFSAQIGYVGTRAEAQQGFVNINASAPGTGNAGRPLAKFGIVNDLNSTEPYKPAWYNGLQSEVHWRTSGAQVGVTYTLSKAMNYQDNDSNPRIQWKPSADLNRGPAGFDRTHNFQTYWVWDLPFGSNQRYANGGGIVSALAAGWQINGVLSVMSGTPFSIVQGSGGNLNAGGSGQVPDQVKTDVNILGGIGRGNPWFDTTAFTPVNIPAGQEQRFGNVHRNSMRGPSFYNLDLGLFRTIPFGGRTRLQLRFEAINALNHANFANPGGDISNAGTFGIISSTTGTGERNLRFGARFSF